MTGCPSSAQPWSAARSDIAGLATGAGGAAKGAAIGVARVGARAADMADTVRSASRAFDGDFLEAPQGAVKPAAWDDIVADTTPRYQQCKALRAEGLSASDAAAALSRKFSVSELSDGTIVTSLGKSAHLEARLFGEGVLHIDSTFVAKPLRGQGISNELFSQTLSYAGPQNVKVVKSYFGPGTNLDVVRAGMERGMTPSQAAALTPRGRTVIQSGFTHVQYDPFTGIFSASR